MREIMRKHGKKVKYIPVPDEGTVLDMDTHEDYSMILMKMGGV
ncbi:MAG: hypothetical protein P8013_03545 [Candidatus Sulfobium sp.]